MTGAANLQAGLPALPVRLKSSPAYKKFLAAESRSSDKIEVAPEGDYYTLAPLLQNDSDGYFLSSNGETSVRFDQTWKDGGDNEFGSSGGYLRITESLTDLGDGMQQIIVQVSAFDAQGNPEPWVDEAFAGEGFINWRLDVGTAAGGDNPIEPDRPFTLVDSLAVALDTAGNEIGEWSISDASDSNGLAGVFVLGADGGDIAGFDLSTIAIIWIIEVDSGGSGIDITAGHSGAWYDPTHDGEGYVLQILSETRAVVFWFSYDQNGNQYWMIGEGVISGSTITFDEVQSTRGGKFGPGFDPDDVERIYWGTLRFQFSDCNNAVVTYRRPFGFSNGTLHVIRLSSIWGVGCAAG